MLYYIEVMKILLACPTYYPDVNGASYAVQRLAFYLQKQGHEVVILFNSRSWHHEMSVHNGISIYGIPSYPVDRIRAPIPFVVNYWTRKVLKEFQPDVVHIASHFSPGRNAAVIARRMGISVVGTNHFMPDNLTHYSHLPKPLEKQLNRMMWKHSLWTLDRIDVVTSPSRIAAQLLTSVGLKNPVQVVSNGIDLQIFHASSSSADLRARYAIPDGPVLLSVCRLDKEKNVDLILRAFKIASEKMSATLVIAGSGAEKKKLQDLAHELGLDSRVVFTGFVPDADLPSLYAISDVFIIAGVAELQCLVAMEAMASGLPVLAVRAMALPELVKDGVGGMLFEHGDVETMAQQMVEIFSDHELRKKLAQGAFAEIQKHDMQQVIQQFEEIYSTVMKKTATA